MLKLEARQCLTTAPEEYDYRWAKTLILNVATDSRGRSLRLVENEDDWHFKQQMMRYGSGLHLTIDRQTVLDEQLEYGLLKLTESPIRIHRRSFDFSSALDWPQHRLDQLIETVEAVRAIEGITFDTSNGGLAYSLEVRGNNELFEQIVESLAEFETPVTVSN
jgi:hypothetical protein